MSRSSCCVPVLCNARGRQSAFQGNLWPGQISWGSQEGWDGIGWVSPVWGVMAVWDAAGDPRGAPARSLARSRCGLGGISSPCAAEAVAPLPVCDSGRELREGRGEADGGWWVVVCFN